MDFQIEILTEQRQCQIFNLVFFRRTILETFKQTLDTC